MPKPSKEEKADKNDDWWPVGEFEKDDWANDGMVRYRFGDDAELMGAWRSVRNVLGPFKTKNGSEGGDNKAPKAA